MTGDLLQSDIDLARELISVGKADEEVISALGYRKISAAKAQLLVHNLRNGIQVEPDPPSQPKRRPISAVEQPASSAQPRPTASPTRKSGNASSVASRASGVPWVRIVLLFAVVLIIVAIFLMKRGSKATGAESSLEQEPRVAAKEAIPPVTVKLEQQKLSVSGNSLSGKNALVTLTKLFGSPTRTFPVADLKRTVYAYDKIGILLYSENQADRGSLLVYFEPVGGTNGAQYPFPGTLTIQSNIITTATESKTLATIPQLALDKGAPDGFIKGTYSGFELTFAHLNLKAPDHLSLVQIDFK